MYTDLVLAGPLPDGRCTAFAGPRRLHVSYGLPEEKVDVRITGHAGAHPSGVVSTVHRPSPGRISPPCPHFGLCGGCTWQHIAYDLQLQLKRRIVALALERAGIHFPEPAATVPSPLTYHYRHRMEYAFSARRWYHEGEGRVTDPAMRVAMGFHLPGQAFKVLSIDGCLLQPVPGFDIARSLHRFAVEQAIPYFDAKSGEGLLRSLVVRITSTGQVMAVVVFAKEDEDTIRRVMDFMAGTWSGVTSLWYSVAEDVTQNYTEGRMVCRPGFSPWITEESNGLLFRIAPEAFYQPNPLQAQKIFARIGELAGLTGTEKVYDLYCGIGTIALHLAGRAGHVTGIDGSVPAIEGARVNATLNGIAHATFIAGDVLKTFTPAFVEAHGKPDLVVLDPPRSGTLIEIKKTILAAAPQKIIYLSCDPHSLAADLRMLTRGYRVVTVEPFDQFPQTHHMETLVLLEREETTGEIVNW